MSAIILFTLISIINLSSCYLLLDIGVTDDDWIDRKVVNFTSNGGWHNGDIILANATTGAMYHGPFDDYTVTQSYSNIAREIRVSHYGYIRMNFTLIFACDILNFTDDVYLLFDQDTSAKKYYWIDRYNDDSHASNSYPYTTQDDFVIEEYYDPILLDGAFCSDNNNAFGEETSWVIYDSYTSPKAYNPGDTFVVGFTGRFNHSSPYDLDGKFWAVTDIAFELMHVITDHPTINPTHDPTTEPTHTPTYLATELLPNTAISSTALTDIELNEGYKTEKQYTVLIVLSTLCVVVFTATVVVKSKKRKKNMTIPEIIELEEQQNLSVNPENALLSDDAVKKKQTRNENDTLIDIQ